MELPEGGITEPKGRRDDRNRRQRTEKGLQCLIPLAQRRVGRQRRIQLCPMRGAGFAVEHGVHQFIDGRRQ